MMQCTLDSCVTYVSVWPPLLRMRFQSNRRLMAALCITCLHSCWPFVLCSCTAVGRSCWGVLLSCTKLSCSALHHQHPAVRPLCCLLRLLLHAAVAAAVLPQRHGCNKCVVTVTRLPGPWGPLLFAAVTAACLSSCHIVACQLRCMRSMKTVQNRLFTSTLSASNVPSAQQAVSACPQQDW
jgi:hypothetical protein